MPFAALPTNARLYYDDLTPTAGTSHLPIVVVHGFLGTAEAHLARLMVWLCGRGHRVVGPTMRGYGQSEPKPRDFPTDFYQRDARDLLAFIDALKLERVHLMGYSDGGEIVLLAAGLQPDRFASVASWGAVGYFGPQMRPVAQRMYPPTWMSDEEKTRNQITKPDVFVLSWIKAVHTMIDAGGDVSLSTADRIACPTLLMLGERDTLNSQEDGARFIERTPSGQLAMFATGHAIHDEDWPAFSSALDAFLAQAEGAR